MLLINNKILPASIAVASIALLVSLCVAPTAHASSVAGFDIYDAADTPTRRTTRKRDGNTTERRTTATDRQGRERTSERRRTVDRDNQSVRTEREVTGRNGRSASSDSTLQRTDDGFTRDTAATGPNGRTATRNSTVSADGEGGVTRQRVTTGPNGGERVRNDAIQRDAENGTFSRQSDRTLADGRTQSVDVSAQRTDNGATRTATLTRADGTQVTRSQEVERAKDTQSDE
ncbi:MAG: hypothetical protein AAFO81_07790 [Pseudomonadota bacterium]